MAGVGRGALAARSVACVRAVAAAGGVWVSFPDVACPAGLRPSSSAAACFAGYGSGSWASLALALGLGARCCVFLPPGVAVPGGWPLVSMAEGWFAWRDEFQPVGQTLPRNALQQHLRGKLQTALRVAVYKGDIWTLPERLWLIENEVAGWTLMYPSDY